MRVSGHFLSLVPIREKRDLQVDEQLGVRVPRGVARHQRQEVITREFAEPEDLLGLHAELFAYLGHALALVDQGFHDRLHRPELMHAARPVMRDGAVDIPCLVLVIDDHHRDHALQVRQQRLASGDEPAMEAVDDGEIRPHDDRQRPAVGQDRLRQQVQIALQDSVRVVVVRLQHGASHHLHVGDWSQQIVQFGH